MWWFLEIRIGRWRGKVIDVGEGKMEGKFHSITRTVTGERGVVSWSRINLEKGGESPWVLEGCWGPWGGTRRDTAGSAKEEYVSLGAASLR